MLKFENVKKALELKTQDTFNYLTLSKSVDCRHKGKYVVKNVVTDDITSYSFYTLQEVVDFYNLDL